MSASGARLPIYDSSGQSLGQVMATSDGGTVFAAVAHMASSLDAQAVWVPQTEKLVVRRGNSRITFTANNPVVVLDDIPYTMPRQARMLGGYLCAPAPSLAQLFTKITTGDLIWDDTRQQWRIETGKTNIRHPRVEVRDNGTMLVMRMPADLHIEEATREPSWLDLTILDGRLDPEEFSFLGSRLPSRSAVRQIRAYQYDDSAQISFRLDPKRSNYEIIRDRGARRFVLLLRPMEPTPATVLEQGRQIEIDEDRWRIHTVVIDAGHGGRDPGSVGPTGLTEREVTWAIAQRLAEKLRKDLDLNVILTRQSEWEFVHLKERGRMAVRENGKLFVSIHTNAHPDRRIGGVETYFLSEPLTDEAAEVARTENAALNYEEEFSAGGGNLEAEVNSILANIASDQFLEESQMLATMVQAELSRSANLRDRGVRQAGFYVMKGTLSHMPSILVETAYISNPAEERMLRRRSFQRQIASGIFRAIRDFKRQRDSTLLRP